MNLSKLLDDRGLSVGKIKSVYRGRWRKRCDAHAEWFDYDSPQDLKKIANICAKIASDEFKPLEEDLTWGKNNDPENGVMPHVPFLHCYRAWVLIPYEARGGYAKNDRCYVLCF